MPAPATWTHEEYERWFADALWRNLIDGSLLPTT
jgi:hypothetical protein